MIVFLTSYHLQQFFLISLNFLNILHTKSQAKAIIADKYTNFLHTKFNYYNNKCIYLYVYYGTAYSTQNSNILNMTDTYRTIQEKSEGFFKDRGSKFYAFAFPVENTEEIDKYRAELRKQYYDARHHVYAFNIGNENSTYRCSDDGEPANSSGPPVLGQIRSQNLTNILIVVVRYFGGTKLGIPGLINAYKSATNDAIANAKIIEKFLEIPISIKFEYANINDAMRLTKNEGVRIVQQNFDNSCSMELMVRKGIYEQIYNSISQNQNIIVVDNG